MGRSKYKMGSLVNGEWFCKCKVRAVWKTAGAGTPNAKRKFQRCANSLKDDKDDCRFFLWEDDRLEAEAEMLAPDHLPPNGGPSTSRKRTVHMAELDSDRDSDEAPTTRHKHRLPRPRAAGSSGRGSTTPTPGPSRRTIPGLFAQQKQQQQQQQQRGEEADDDSMASRMGVATAAPAAAETTLFDAVMGILVECEVEVPQEARLRIQVALSDHVDALEDRTQRIRQLERRVAYLTELNQLVNGKGKGKEAYVGLSC